MKLTNKEKELLRKLFFQSCECRNYNTGCCLTNEEYNFLRDSLLWAGVEEEEDFCTKLDECIDNLSLKEIETLEQNFRIKEYQATPKELNYSTESLRDKIREWNIDPIFLIEIYSQDFSFDDEFFAIRWVDEEEPDTIYSWEGISEDFYDYCVENQVFPTAFKN